MDRIKKFTANNNCIKAENKEEKLIISVPLKSGRVKY